MTLQQAYELVDRGIALLDKKGPANWREKIDLATLDLSAYATCILVQIYGSYWIGARALSFGDYDSDTWLLRHGFDIPIDDVEADLTRLRAAWVERLSA